MLASLPMAQVPTPPASRHSSEAPEVQQKETQGVDTAGLLQTLDTLLERYLHLLDRHQKLQTGLAKRLSSGFLSLAHANYTCPPGRRYGADYYDERMKATRKVSLHTPSCLDTDESTNNTQPNHLGHTYTIESTPNKRDDEQTGEKETPVDKPSDVGSSSDDSPTPKEEKKNTTEAADGSSTSESRETDSTTPLKPSQPRKKFRSSDPITWYGILVPPSLRNAQRSFTEAVDGDLPELASVVAEMQFVEKEVNQVRSRLRLYQSV